MDVYEQTLHEAGFALVAGADEAGRGACAGPLVAAAVILGQTAPDGLDDSKRLTPTRRAKLYDAILAQAVAVAWVRVEAADCDRLGMQRADLDGLCQAIEELDPAPDFAITDGFAVPGLTCPSVAMWKGDQVVQCVSAASIIAKVTRDRIMDELAVRYPGYGFEVHKGYVTGDHQRALDRLGPCPEHRLSYRNVSQPTVPSI